MEYAGARKTEDWTMDKLEKILKPLKKNKSRDQHGFFINELLRPGVIGNDLKKSLLMLLLRRNVYGAAMSLVGDCTVVQSVCLASWAVNNNTREFVVGGVDHGGRM